MKYKKKIIQKVLEIFIAYLKDKMGILKYGHKKENPLYILL